MRRLTRVNCGLLDHAFQGAKAYRHFGEHSLFALHAEGSEWYRRNYAGQKPGFVELRSTRQITNLSYILSEM